MNILSILDELNTSGYEYRKTKIDYSAFEHYKQLFQYILIKQYNINQLFVSVQREYCYYQYNTITLMNETDCERIAFFLNRYLNKINGITCILVDIQDHKKEYGFHTSLLIYRSENKTLEHFDSNGITYEKNYVNFNRIIELLTDVTFINSVDLNGLRKYTTDTERYLKSLNVLSSSVMSKSFPGYCQLWSLLLYEFIYLFKDKSSNEIISDIYLYLKGKRILEARHTCKNIIRGYFEYISTIDEEINIDILNNYNPLYILSDKILKNKVEDYMDKRVVDLYIDENLETDSIKL